MRGEGSFNIATGEQTELAHANAPELVAEQPEITEAQEADPVVQKSIERWLRNPKEVSGEAMLEEIRQDGMFLTHVTYYADKTFAKGVHTSTFKNNVAEGRRFDQSVTMEASPQVHFGLNKLYSSFENDRTDTWELENRNTAPQAVVWIAHPGMLATKHGIDVNLRQYDGRPINDVRVASLTGDWQDESGDVGLENYIMLAPKSVKVDENGQPAKRNIIGELKTRAEWQQQMVEDGWQPTGEIHPQTGTTQFVDKYRSVQVAPTDFALTSQEYWTNKFQQAKAENKPIPKGIFFYEGNAAADALDQFKAWAEIPAQPNVASFRQKIDRLDGTGYLMRSNTGDVQRKLDLGNGTSPGLFYTYAKHEPPADRPAQPVV